MTPNGTLTANSHCQVPRDRMPAAMVGPMAVETATTRGVVADASAEGFLRVG